MCMFVYCYCLILRNFHVFYLLLKMNPLRSKANFSIFLNSPFNELSSTPKCFIGKLLAKSQLYVQEGYICYIKVSVRFLKFLKPQIETPFEHEIVSPNSYVHKSSVICE